MKTKYLLVVSAVILSIVLLVGCSSYSSQPASPSTPKTQTSSTATPSNQVNIAGFAFSPQTLTVAKGTTVTWTNNDSTTHTVTSDSGVWDSGNLAVGKTFSYTFNQTGTFPYHCQIHTNMTAKIVVQ